MGGSQSNASIAPPAEGDLDDITEENSALYLGPYKPMVARTQNIQMQALLWVPLLQKTFDMTSLVQWESSDPSIATVDSDEAMGLVTAQNPGVVTIRARIGSRTASLDVIVNNFAEAGVFALPTRASGYDGFMRSLAVTEEERVFAVYEKGPSLITEFFDGSKWISSTIDSPHVCGEGSAPGHELVINQSGSAAVVYGVFSIKPNHCGQDWYRFGISYFDGNSWKYSTTIQGSLLYQWRGSPGLHVETPASAMDGNGIVYVAYQGVAQGDAGLYHANQLLISRFNRSGLIDTVSFPESVGDLHVSINSKNQVMVLNTASGSRIFDGHSWQSLRLIATGRFTAPAYVKLNDSGTADFLWLDYKIEHYHYDGSVWSNKVDVSGEIYGSAAAASDANGNIMIVYESDPSYSSTYRIRGNYFNGSVWSAPGDVSNPTSPATSPMIPQLVAISEGRFISLFRMTATGALHANYFDGSWHKPSLLGTTWILGDAVLAARSNGDIALFGMLSSFPLGSGWSNHLVFFNFFP
ncbi:MAG: Ig-like domain-containing protein [Spirochaetia bacterium]|nr:Ig-like domain-containing protein [Spirochaetia bacterium]